MWVRFFGSSNCKDCLELFVLLNKYQIDYEYIDAMEDDEETQKFCDKHDVDELPHIQILDENDNIIITHVGSISEEDFNIYLIDYFSEG